MRPRTLITSALALLHLTCWGFLHLSAQSFSRGTDFFVGMPNNAGGNALCEIRIVSETAATGTITSATGLNQAFSVAPGSPYVFPIPAAQVVTTHNTVENKGIRIIASAPVSTFLASTSPTVSSTDATVAIPTPSLGQSFRTATIQNINNAGFLIVGTVNNTVVTITTTCGTSANVPFNVTLNQGQTYRWVQMCDLSGSRIQSTQPIQVFNMSDCSQVPTGITYCDFLLATAVPTARWGTTYVTAPLAGRNNIDLFQVVANTNGTSVYNNGALVGTLNAGGILTLTLGGGNVITATQPIHVMQFARSNSVSGSYGDPAQAHLFPTSMFHTRYRFPTLLDALMPAHNITVITRTAGAASVRLDGAPMTFTAMGGGWSYAQSNLSSGEHVLTSDSISSAVLHSWRPVGSYATPVGANDPTIILPIGDVRLHGESTPAGNLLQWECPEDLLGGHFDLQRALETDHPTVISAHAAPGPLRHLDTDVLPGQTWLYRLRHHGPDGETTTSDWVAIQAASRPEAISVSPNPAAADIQLSIGFEAAGDLNIRILDAQGRVVREIAAALPAGSRTLQLDRACQGLAPGMYSIEVQSGAERHSTKFIHQ